MKYTVTLILIVTILAATINFSEAWPFGDTDEKLSKIVEFINGFQKDVIDNDKKLRESIDVNMKNVENVLNEMQWKLNEVISNVNRLLEGRQMNQIRSFGEKEIEF